MVNKNPHKICATGNNPQFVELGNFSGLSGYTCFHGWGAIDNTLRWLADIELF